MNSMLLVTGLIIIIGIFSLIYGLDQKNKSTKFILLGISGICLIADVFLIKQVMQNPLA